jgi:5-(carboxyamino)imidazole ribonucleotide synthase
VQNGKLLANEMAPRVHNSGHLTIEGSETSQFENHMRAVLGLPLGPVKPKAKAVMINCIGSMPKIGDLAKQSNVFVHDYGKAPKPNRKVGHITIIDDGKNFEQTVEAVRRVAEKA